jgi:hypothetical protein
MSKIKIKQNIFNGLNYNESIDLYFEKKGQYLENRKNTIDGIMKQHIDKSVKKQKIDNLKFTCSNCDRTVNMTFEQTKDKYIVKCGDTTNPCNINKSFSKKHEIPLNDLAEIYKDNMEDIKKDIILTKLDLLFDYESEKLSSENFKTLIAELKGVQEKHAELFKNFAKKNLMVEKKNSDGIKLLMTREKAIEEYNEELKKNINLFKNTLNQYYNPKIINDKSLNSIMQFYQTDIMPILQNLRKCIYQDTDIITLNNNIGKTKLPPTYYIKNYKITPSNMNVRI